jgi:hypothetical protein
MIQEGEGTALTWTLTAGEEPRVYFAVAKGADQSIAVGGTDADTVEEVTIAGTTPEGFTVPALDSAIVVYAVDTADLIFDGDFGTGTPERSFTLTVTETGCIDRVYTALLRPVLDWDTTATIYRRVDGRWLKIRNPTLSADNVAYAQAGSSLSSIIYADAPVQGLEAALGWVSFNAESGTGENLVGGTTAGYSEYRIFLKSNQTIGPIMVNYPGDKNRVSLELYGAGSPGLFEQTITRNRSWNTNTTALLRNGGAVADGYGLLTLNSNKTGSHIFILGKNVTLSGNNEDFVGNNTNETTCAGVRTLLNVWQGVVVIMRDYSKITGYVSSAGYMGMAAYHTPIRISAASGAIFYMEGGAITGNTFNAQFGVAFMVGYNANVFYKTGGDISGNTRDLVRQNDRDSSSGYTVNVAPLTNPPSGWPTE